MKGRRKGGEERKEEEMARNREPREGKEEYLLVLPRADTVGEDTNHQESDRLAI